jgi:hypothetical protein
LAAQGLTIERIELSPKVSTIDVLPNKSYKISFKIDGTVAILRRVATHKTIDRTP